MQVTGNFPFIPEAWNGFGNKTKYSHPSHMYLGAASSQEILNTLGPAVKSAVLRDASTFLTTSNPPPTHFGPFACVVSGAAVPNPPDKFFSYKMKNNNSPFMKRVRQDEIIMSDYYAAQGWSSYQNAISDLKPPTAGVNRSFFEDQTQLFQTEMTPHGKLLQCGTFDLTLGSFSIPTQRRTVSLDSTPYDMGWDDGIIERLLQDVSFDADSALITEITAEANRRLVDALTAVAEAPETVKSVINGCKQVIKLYKDAKNREFRLMDKMKSIKGLNKSEMNEMQRAKFLKDLTDAIADVWLNFRYNIMPTVYTIEDIIRTSESLGKSFLRDRGAKLITKNWDINLPSGWTLTSGSTQALHRVCIKRSYSAVGITDWRHLVSMNGFVTAWELVPLSFVVDWVLNIGNVLSALITPSVPYRQGATISWKIDSTMQFQHTSTASVDLKLAVYRRTVINPSDYCRLKIDPDFSPYRQLDAIALSWKLLVGSLSR